MCQHCNFAFLASKNSLTRDFSTKIISVVFEENSHFLFGIVADLTIRTYNLPMKTTRKIVAVTSLAAITMFSLSACSPLTPIDEEMTSAQHKVIEVDSGVLSYTWEYEDADGNREKMFECERTAFIEDPCVETPDGRAQFEYRMVKGNVWYPSITYDGVEHDTDCVLTGDKFWSDWSYHCRALD